jgi:hypothetical protein
MRRLVLIAAILTTALAIGLNAPLIAGQVSVSLFFGAGVLALLWVCTPRRTRKTHQQ